MIKNAKDKSINDNSFLNLEGSNFYQALTIEVITKKTVNFELTETKRSVNFKGVIFPTEGEDLKIVPEGQRSFKNVTIFSEVTLQLNLDDIVLYKGTRFRILKKLDYENYGFYKYLLTEGFSSD